MHKKIITTSFLAFFSFSFLSNNTISTSTLKELVKQDKLVQAMP